MANLKYFSEKEFVCNGENCFDKMNPQLLELLDKARHIAGVPFKITSSFRDEETNEKVGGKKSSAHLSGNAVDISCHNSTERMLIIDALLSAGFTRIGIAKVFVHADVDKDLPQKVIWTY